MIVLCVLLSLCLPRARGDRPHVRSLQCQSRRSPPRTRGSTSNRRARAVPGHVSPAHAGIDLRHSMARPRTPSLPRARGDRPLEKTYRLAGSQSPPRTRGSTRDHGVRSHDVDVSPAHAGIDPASRGPWCTGCSLPRARGDRPCVGIVPTLGQVSPPRTRGSTRRDSSGKSHWRVSPAHAGIDLLNWAPPDVVARLPRARGDRPQRWNRCRNGGASPPRTRGSTSLRARGEWPVGVSPAHAGIDPWGTAAHHIPDGLPRARGDRPALDDGPDTSGLSPPRTRGSTCGYLGVSAHQGVSPAHAGIDPAVCWWAVVIPGLPRARGDRP